MVALGLRGQTSPGPEMRARLIPPVQPRCHYPKHEVRGTSTFHLSPRLDEQFAHVVRSHQELVCVFTPLHKARKVAFCSQVRAQYWSSSIAQQVVWTKSRLFRRKKYTQWSNLYTHLLSSMCRTSDRSMLSKDMCTGTYVSSCGNTAE